MNNNDKFSQAVQNLRPNTKLAWNNEITTEEEFNKVKWQTGIDETNSAILTITNPYPELTWSAVNAEMTRLQTEYDSLEYARNRQKEYPSFADQLDKIYHEGIDKWKDEMIKPVKDKYPKESS
jgi:hypothetical protein